MFDKLKGSVDGLKDKLSDIVDDHGAAVGEQLDKAADFADDKTGGKFSEHIDKAVNAVKDAADDLDGVDDDDLGANRGAGSVDAPPPPAEAPSI